MLTNHAYIKEVFKNGKKQLLIVAKIKIQEYNKTVCYRKCFKNNTRIGGEKQYKGSFNVRIKPELHREAAIVAKRNNISLNQLVERAIINQLRTN